MGKPKVFWKVIITAEQKTSGQPVQWRKQLGPENDGQDFDIVYTQWLQAADQNGYKNFKLHEARRFEAAAEILVTDYIESKKLL